MQECKYSLTKTCGVLFKNLNWIHEHEFLFPYNVIEGIPNVVKNIYLFVGASRAIEDYTWFSALLKFFSICISLSFYSISPFYFGCSRVNTSRPTLLLIFIFLPSTPLMAGLMYMFRFFCMIYHLFSFGDEFAYIYYILSERNSHH